MCQAPSKLLQSHCIDKWGGVLRKMRRADGASALPNLGSEDYGKDKFLINTDGCVSCRLRFKKKGNLLTVITPSKE